MASSNINLKNIWQKVTFSLILFVIAFDLVILPFSIANATPSSEKTDKSIPLSLKSSGQAVTSSPDMLLNQSVSASSTGLQANISKSTTTKAKLPKNKKIKVKKVKIVKLTSYTSEVKQCDKSPCITANGYNLCKNAKEDSVAANFLPFGTKIRIPDYFGDRIFIVRDRMNKRFQDRIDIWMISKQKALKFGVKQAKVEILEK